MTNALSGPYKFDTDSRSRNQSEVTSLRQDAPVRIPLCHDKYLGRPPLTHPPLFGLLPQRISRGHLLGRFPNGGNRGCQFTNDGNQNQYLVWGHITVPVEELEG